MNESQKAIIEAAKRVCASITDEDIHNMASNLDFDNKDGKEFAAAMTDLGMAVQLYEALE